MDSTTLPNTMGLVLYGARARSLEEVISRLSIIEDPAKRYDQQLIILDTMVDIHDAVDDTIERFYTWVQEDGAYKSKHTMEELHEKFATVTSIVEENRRRRNKLREATAEVVKRWGPEIIPALTKTQGTEPSSTMAQRLRKLAGKTGLYDGILRVNRAMYIRLTTRQKGVRATKAFTPGDFAKALDLRDAAPLTDDELKEIGMHLSHGPIQLLYAGVAPELVDDSCDVGSRGGNMKDFEGRASELDVRSPPMASVDMEEEGPISTAMIDIRRRQKRAVPEIATASWHGLDGGESSEESDDIQGSRTTRLRGCGCSRDGRATWSQRVSRRAFVTEAVALSLLDEMMDMSRVCFKHMRDMGGKLGLRVKKLSAAELRLRLGRIHEDRNKIGDMKMANDTVQWFRRKNRPPHPADALGTYKFLAEPFEAAFSYDQSALQQWIGGIDMEAWARDGSVNVDLFGWWWETGLIELILSEFEMYHFHLREMNGNPNWGWLRNMYHSTGQQLMRQDPLYYALYASLRPDKHWRLVSYPYYAKYNKAGDATFFRHIDINIPAALETGKGIDQIQGTVSLDDEDESQATIILAGTHLKQLGELWARICDRNQQTNGHIHRFTAPMVTKEDMAAIGVAWKAVACKKGQVRVTKPTVPHGANGPATGTRRTMLPWYVGVRDDCESLEITDGGTWEGLAKGHREMVGGETSPSGLPALFGTVPYRFPAAVELTGLGPLSDALVCRLKWNSPLVLMHRNQVLAGGKEGLWRYIRDWRTKAGMAAREAHATVQRLERQAFGKRSYYYLLEQSEQLGTQMPVMASDFGPDVEGAEDLSDEEDVEDAIEVEAIEGSQPTTLVFAEQGIRCVD